MSSWLKAETEGNLSKISLKMKQLNNLYFAVQKCNKFLLVSSMKCSKNINIPISA